MLLAIDIGNSSIKFGIFDGPSLIHKFNIATKRDYTTEELLFDRFHVLDEKFIQLEFTAAVAVSVVPVLDEVFKNVCLELFKVRTAFVTSETDLGMKIDYQPPSAAGADRIVNAFAAKELYGPPAMVCSFGTATTIDVVDEQGTYIGGLITAGMGTTADALHQRAAKLPNVQIRRPDKVIQNQTDAGIMAGLYYGHAAMAAGLIELVRDEYSSAHPKSTELKVIATGGFSALLNREIEAFDLLDENLTLNGLRLVADRLKLQG